MATSTMQKPGKSAWPGQGRPESGAPEAKCGAYKDQQLPKFIGFQRINSVIHALSVSPPPLLPFH